MSSEDIPIFKSPISCLQLIKDGNQFFCILPAGKWSFFPFSLILCWSDDCLTNGIQWKLTSVSFSENWQPLLPLSQNASPWDMPSLTQPSLCEKLQMMCAHPNAQTTISIHCQPCECTILNIPAQLSTQMFAAPVACDNVEVKNTPNELMDLAKEISIELLDVFRPSSHHVGQRKYPGESRLRVDYQRAIRIPEAAVQPLGLSFISFQHHPRLLTPQPSSLISSSPPCHHHH